MTSIIKLEVDTYELQAAVEEIESLFGKLSTETLDGLRERFETLVGGGDLAVTEQRDLVTERARKLIIIARPSDSLLSFLAALRACEGQGSVTDIE